CRNYLRIPTASPPSERRSHERHDVLRAGLPDLQAVEESLHNDQRPGLVRYAVEVIEFERLLEARRKDVLRFRAVNGAPGVGDGVTNSFGVVNGKDDLAVQKFGFSGKVADSEMLRSFPRDPAFRQVGMVGVNVLKLEREGLVLFATRLALRRCCFYWGIFCR